MDIQDLRQPVSVVGNLYKELGKPDWDTQSYHRPLDLVQNKSVTGVLRGLLYIPLRFAMQKQD